MVANSKVYVIDGKCRIGSEGYVLDNFKKLKVNHQNWTKLWQDPKTGEYWMEYCEHPELHAGGPPSFVKINEEEAKSEFGSW